MKVEMFSMAYRLPILIMITKLIFYISDKDIILYLNKNNQFKRTTIIENIDDTINSLYLIDHNNDYENDLILLGHKGLHVYNKTPNKLEFKKHKFIPLSYALPYALATYLKTRA